MSALFSVTLSIISPSCLPTALVAPCTAPCVASLVPVPIAYLPTVAGIDVPAVNGAKARAVP